jgi:5-(carboxyamino)imidazole ribonucleotide synthase
VSRDVAGPVVTPPATIGMLGGGQLGRYALMAARSMGYRTVVLEPDERSPAGSVADEHLVAAYDDAAALDRLASACAVVTTEFENPPASSLERLARSTAVAPSAAAVAIAQDRRSEKRFLAEAGFPIGPWGVVESADHRPDVGFPAILKTAHLGYDGKGQTAIASIDDIGDAWTALGARACVLERALALDSEISVVVARAADGRTATYEVSENHHVDGVLDLTVVPARVTAPVAERATELARAVADALDYVGVLAIELFVVTGELYVNELAPRPHNSGHWTLDAARTSQFEQQIRAVCGIGLGETAMTAPAAAMVNLLGDLWHRGEPDWARAFDEPRASVHLYGKAVARPGRKMGHLTITGSSADDVAAEAHQLRDAISRSR